MVYGGEKYYVFMSFIMLCAVCVRALSPLENNWIFYDKGLQPNYMARSAQIRWLFSRNPNIY